MQFIPGSYKSHLKMETIENMIGHLNGILWKTGKETLLLGLILSTYPDMLSTYPDLLSTNLRNTGSELLASRVCLTSGEGDSLPLVGHSSGKGMTNYFMIHMLN